MTPINIVSLSSVTGIGVVAVSNGLGGLPSTPPTPPANPLLALGGAENEEWWQKGGRGEAGLGLEGDALDATLGYVRTVRGLDSDVAWELGEDPYGIGRPVTLGQFTSKIVAASREEEHRDALARIVRELYRQDQDEAKQRQKIVKVTISAAGLTYVAWKILPLL